MAERVAEDRTLADILEGELLPLLPTGRRFDPLRTEPERVDVSDWVHVAAELMRESDIRPPEGFNAFNLAYTQRKVAILGSNIYYLAQALRRGQAQAEIRLHGLRLDIVKSNWRRNGVWGKQLERMVLRFCNYDNEQSEVNFDGTPRLVSLTAMILAAPYSTAPDRGLLVHGRHRDPLGAKDTQFSADFNRSRSLIVAANYNSYHPGINGQTVKSSLAWGMR